MPSPQSVPEALVQIAQALGEVTYPDVPGALVGIANALTSAAADGNVPTLLGEVTLSSAQLLDLHNTPVELVASPGAGMWIDVHRLLLWLAFGTVAYATSDMTGISLKFEGQADNALASTGDLTLTESLRFGYPANGFGGIPSDANKALQVCAPNGSTVFTDGDGTLTIYVFGTVHSVPA